MGVEQKILDRGANLRAYVASALWAMAALSACGQKGNLYMPNDPEFQQRAKLPDLIRRQLPGEVAKPLPNPASTSADTPTTAPAASSPTTTASSATGR